MHRQNNSAWKLAALTISAAILPAAGASARDYHMLMGIPEPTGVWPTMGQTPAAGSVTTAADAVAQMAAADSITDAAGGPAFAFKFYPPRLGFTGSTRRYTSRAPSSSHPSR